MKSLCEISVLGLQFDTNVPYYRYIRYLKL